MLDDFRSVYLVITHFNVRRLPLSSLRVNRILWKALGARVPLAQTSTWSSSVASCGFDFEVSHSHPVGSSHVPRLFLRRRRPPEILSLSSIGVPSPSWFLWLVHLSRGSYAELG